MPNNRRDPLGRGGPSRAPRRRSRADPRGVVRGLVGVPSRRRAAAAWLVAVARSRFNHVLAPRPTAAPGLGGLGFDVVTRSAPASDGNSPTVVFLDIIDTAKKVGRPYLDSDDDDDSDDDEPETEDEDAEMVEHAQGEGGASDGGPSA